MFRKARVKVTVYRNPVRNVTLGDASSAANIHFGEMTESHARRERRRQRRRHSRYLLSR